ncbi:hypothetical protein JW711_01375 [Candidatus Woesearchaeota archaeon]|nr:hypothetical protein [Candidatus Woesearchaeota archaeon]
MRDLNRYKQIIMFEDGLLGLKAVLAIHDGGLDEIAIGGCRVCPYPDEEAAVNDAKRLASNMSLKYQVTGLPYTGMKLVVYSMNQRKRQESFKKIGAWIESLKGSCYIATDAGSSQGDMTNVFEETRYVLDLPPEYGGFGSFLPLLTEGVMQGLHVAADMKLKKKDFGNLTAYVSGFGHSGLAIAERLLNEGCLVSGYDLSSGKNRLAETLGVNILDNFMTKHYNLLVPCSVGTVIKDIIPNADIIGGSANHPIMPEFESQLHSRGIITIPDFVISSGAILIDDLIIQGKTPTLDVGIARTGRIADFTKEILARAGCSGRSLREEALYKLGY